MKNLEKSKYALEESEYEILNFLFPGYSWTHLESRVSLPLEEDIKHGGKYVIYGLKEEVEELAEKLESKIGNTINAIKFSTVPVKVTPHAPENQHALLVYCDKRRRTEVMKILEYIGADNYVWKSTRESWREILDDPWTCLILYLSNAEKFRKVCKLVNKEESFKGIKNLMKFSAEYAEKFRKLAKLIESGEITSLEEIKAFLGT